MGYRTRVMENMVDTSKEITPGRVNFVCNFYKFT